MTRHAEAEINGNNYVCKCDIPLAKISTDKRDLLFFAAI